MSPICYGYGIMDIVTEATGRNGVMDIVAEAIGRNG
jgi:hypothetical protein